RGKFYVAHLNNTFDPCSCRGRRVACTDSSLPSIGLSRLRWEARTGGGSAAPPGDANNNAAFAALRWDRGPSRTGTTARSTRAAVLRLNNRAQPPLRSKTRRGELE